MRALHSANRPARPPSKRAPGWRQRSPTNWLQERLVEARKAGAIGDTLPERGEARDGTVYFVLKAGNGEIVGTSEMYNGSSARERGIESVKVNAPAAGVEG